MTYSNDTGLPSVTEVLKPWIDSEWFTEESRDRGHAVHGATSAYLLGLWAPPLPAAWQPYFDSARRWIDTNVEQVVLVEERLIDRDRRFCGKEDLIATMRGSNALVLIDWKTSQAVCKWWALQDAAYRHLAKHDRGLDCQRGLTVRLKKNGSGGLPTEHGRPAYHMNIFQGVLNAHLFFNREIRP